MRSLYDLRDEDIARIRAKLGLDRPFLAQVGIWVGQIVRGDLGTSIFSGLPVSTLIGQRVGATLSLTLLAMLISVGLPQAILNITATSVAIIVFRQARRLAAERDLLAAA